MNFGVYAIFFIAGCTGIITGMKFNNKLILFPSVFVTTVSGLLIIFTLFLVGGIK